MSTPRATRCRLCRAPLRDDLFTVEPGHDRSMEVHRACAFDFARDFAFVQWIDTDDDGPLAARWHTLWFELIALDPVAHVDYLLDQVARP